MRAFTDPLKRLGGFTELTEYAQKNPGLYAVTGCIDAQKPQLIYGFGAPDKTKLVITFSEQRARELYEEYSFFDPEIVYYPAKDVLFYQSDIRGNKLTAERLCALKALSERKAVTLVTTFDALMNTMAPMEMLLDHILHFEPEDTVDIDRLRTELNRMGYEKEYQAQSPGQYAIRGGIIDIYPVTEELPVRIELWDDEIDTIRSFDAETQKSVETLDEVFIYPACELVLSEAEKQEGILRMQKEADQVYKKMMAAFRTEEAYRVKRRMEEQAEQWGELADTTGMDACLSYFCRERNCLLDYLNPKQTLIFFDELSRCTERGRATELEFSESMKQRLEMGYILPGQMKELFGEKELLAKLDRFPCISLAILDNKPNGLTLRRQLDINVQSVGSYNNHFELLVKDLQKYKKRGFGIVLLSGSRSRAKRLAEDLMDEGLSSFYTENYDHELAPGQIMVCYGKIRRGFEYPLLKYALITESDIFGAEKKKKKHRHSYEGEHIQSFSDLAVGDYVVHENHGLGIYRGIEKIEVEHKVKDYLKIEYADGGNLYILATQLELIQKYASRDAGEGKRSPKLNRLDNQDWSKTKAKVRTAVKQIAGDLVRLYAEREKENGYVYGPDTIWQREFEELFPFEETDDQVTAIEETKKDMESPKIMDRLICGDVGYGKTEIAIRAAFKAVQDNKQVAYLAPTTILAQQIYNTFCQRMKDFPVRVDLLCRFRSAAEQRKTIADLKKGQVDIVVGTHRLLSKDVAFSNLGLLVVDEEQRFGVTHKERIKQLKTNVDVLTLTATPIPRTLHMSLIGIRDMSVLEEPPMDRQPIQTYVLEYNEELVREAINRELARDGQVYYVYNQVRTIADTCARIQALVPDAVVAYAHGQMRETELEKIMYSFINGEIDVLVSTTIIETGLDISNVNTMIIHDADNMGLSQLYQLRGRVGRSNRTAYAFLMYRRNKLLKEVAEKRLAAIREYTELGSGFKVAMRDLEIRGAGNLLGAEQSGHMEAIGYDLYCKMLHEAVKEAKGELQEEKFDTSLDLTTDAYIPSGYIANEFQKLDVYKRIAGINSQEESDEMLEELLDRFGEPPKTVQNLLRIAVLKAKANRVYVKEVIQRGDILRLTMFEHAKINPDRIPELVERNAPAMVFTMDAKNPFFSYVLKANSREKNREVLDVLAQLLGEMELLLG